MITCRNLATSSSSLPRDTTRRGIRMSRTCGISKRRMRVWDCRLLTWLSKLKCMTISSTSRQHKTHWRASWCRSTRQNSWMTVAKRMWILRIRCQIFRLLSSSRKNRKGPAVGSVKAISGTHSWFLVNSMSRLWISLRRVTIPGKCNHASSRRRRTSLRIRLKVDMLKLRGINWIQRRIATKFSR